MSLLLFTVWLNIIDEVVLVWSNFVSSTQWSDKETSVNRSSTWIILYHTSYTPPDASLHIHHHNRHLLTTGDNSITSPDVSSPSPSQSVGSLLDKKKAILSSRVWTDYISIYIWGSYSFNTNPSPLLLSPSIFCCYWDTSPVDYTFAMKHNIVSGSNQTNRKSLSLSCKFLFQH